MKVLVPIEITSAMLGPQTNIPEDPTAAWANATYAIGDERHVVATGRVYRDSKGGPSAISPQNDTSRWKDIRPTNRMAPFDYYRSTVARANGMLRFEILPEFFNTIRLDGLIGGHVKVEVYEQGKPDLVVPVFELDLFDPIGGWYEWLFSPFGQLRTALVTNIPPTYPARVVITVTAPANGPVGVGMISLGDLRPLVPEEYWGDAEHGSSAEPVTYSYIDVDEDGQLMIVRRNFATNLSVRVQMDRRAADYALQAVQEVLDVPCLWVATDAAGYNGLSTFGLGSGRLSYDSFGNAVFNISVKGTI